MLVVEVTARVVVEGRVVGFRVLVALEVVAELVVEALFVVVETKVVVVFAAGVEVASQVPKIHIPLEQVVPGAHF